ncbi:LOW QUALITY PROTEIN: L-selectin-like [Aplochiton taeniatus]
MDQYISYKVHSTSPNHNWNTARQWCQKNFTNMVAIQNREISFLNQMLPFDPSYYWIGTQVNPVWRTNKTLTQEAENWASGEPNNKQDQQDWVEIYIRKQRDTAKWNDERCSNLKGTLCYAASCSEHSCGAHAECLENIGNLTCQCDPGFQGNRSFECENMSSSIDCDYPYGPFSFNLSCMFHCATAYQLVGGTKLICQADGHWDHPSPKCQVKTCLALHSAIRGGRMNCSHPLGLSRFNSTCEFSCTERFLNGPASIQCDHTGQWAGNVPTCTGHILAVE